MNAITLKIHIFKRIKYDLKGLEGYIRPLSCHKEVARFSLFTFFLKPFDITTLTNNINICPYFSVKNHHFKDFSFHFRRSKGRETKKN